MIHAGTDEGRRRLVAEALASTLGASRHPDVQAFVLRQLQLVGGREVVPAVARLLGDDALGEVAAQTLLAIRDGAAEAFWIALQRAEGRHLVVIAHALGTLRVTASADALRQLLTSADRDARLTAAWALAEIVDTAAAEPLLKAAGGATGFERSKLTQACLQLAENLLSAGKKKEAAGIYARLHGERTDDSERHVREAAARGLAAIR